MKLTIETTINTDIEIDIADYNRLVSQGYTYVPLADVKNAGDFIAVKAPNASASSWAGYVVFTKTVYAAVFERVQYGRAILYLMRKEEQ